MLLKTKHNSKSLKAQIEEVIENILLSGVDGCITGSCLLDDDFDMWDTAPDIDVFAYSEASFIHMICELDNIGYVPGGKDKKASGEKMKRHWILTTGVNSKAPLSTIMYEDPKTGLSINVTYKKNCDSLVEVLSSFDMSIIMKGIDISTRFMLDLTTSQGSDAKTAVPNKLKRHLYNHPSRFEVQRCLRQWDRVVKYYNRGYDTRPMAKFYLDIIHQVLEAGAAFGTEKDIISFEEMMPEFLEMDEIITSWLIEHEDD